METHFGPYRLDRHARQLPGPHGPIDLSARSVDILALLLERPQDVITKDELLDAVWPGVAVGENTLHVQVSALRKALPSDHIATVHGRGYKYAGPDPHSAPQSVAPASARRPPI